MSDTLRIGRDVFEAPINFDHLALGSHHQKRASEGSYRVIRRENSGLRTLCMKDSSDTVFSYNIFFIELEVLSLC